MGKKWPDFDSILSTDKNFVSKGTLDQRSKEKKEAEKASEKNNSILNTIKLNKETSKRIESNIKKLKTEKTNLEGKVRNLEEAKKFTEKSWSKWALWEIENEIKSLKSRIRSIDISLNNSTSSLKWTKDRIQKLEKEYEKTLQNHLKEKQEFEIANKKAINEFRKNVEKNNEIAQKQSEYYGIKNELIKTKNIIDKKNLELNWDNNKKTWKIKELNKANSDLNKILLEKKKHINVIVSIYNFYWIKFNPKNVINENDVNKLKNSIPESDTDYKKFMNSVNVLKGYKGKRYSTEWLLDRETKLRKNINALGTDIKKLNTDINNLNAKKKSLEEKQSQLIANTKKNWINIIV